MKLFPYLFLSIITVLVILMNACTNVEEPILINLSGKWEVKEHILHNCEDSNLNRTFEFHCPSDYCITVEYRMDGSCIIYSNVYSTQVERVVEMTDTAEFKLVKDSLIVERSDGGIQKAYIELSNDSLYQYFGPLENCSITQVFVRL